MWGPNQSALQLRGKKKEKMWGPRESYGVLNTWSINSCTSIWNMVESFLWSYWLNIRFFGKCVLIQQDGAIVVNESSVREWCVIYSSISSSLVHAVVDFTLFMSTVSLVFGLSTLKAKMCPTLYYVALKLCTYIEINNLIQWTYCVMLLHCTYILKIPACNYSCN